MNCIIKISTTRNISPAICSISQRAAFNIFLRLYTGTGKANTSNDFGETLRANLILEDGTTLKGWSFGSKTSSTGEIVFNTGMVGYPENLTDPSYHGQVLTLTYPIMGNYGVPDTKALDKWGLFENMESGKIHVKGLIVQDYTAHPSHWKSVKTLGRWLEEEGVPALWGIDTRMLTKRIRKNGSMLAKIEFEEQAIEFDDPNVRNLIKEVSVTEKKVYGKGNRYKVILVDCGVKHSIIRCLVERDVEVHLVPWNYDYSKEDYDGLFVTNGPGDPLLAPETMQILRKVIDSNRPEPICGICMGNQMLGIAAGGNSYKLPLGNRGQNQPVMNLLSGQAFITPQNHGYAIDIRSLSDEWKPLFININDLSNEGIMHTSKPIFTAQFHPEANGGPTDTMFLFDYFIRMMGEKTKGLTDVMPQQTNVTKRIDVKKVLVLGSGGLSIGQAGEFDYSGSQALKALKEENIKTVLLNPNVASVQTEQIGDKQADAVYFLPVTKEFIKRVVEEEQPDGILLSVGGQTALNRGVELYQEGFFQKHGVKILGTPIESVILTEDRDKFAEKLKEIGEKFASSIAATSVADALKAAEIINYPVMVRSAFALGGLGSGICHNKEELVTLASNSLAATNQILIEKSLLGWKEVEYEVMRDAADNCITVCNMENFDPVGVHTGESIVVAPSQTLSDQEYHMLRETAIRCIRHLGIVGECNIQYALDPYSLDYCIIEVNARLSRSSALASKATGYPLAFIATKLSLGITLPELKNNTTGTTTACFEPSLDYIVTKIPKWDLDRFAGVSDTIGSSMKSVGEVMAIGRTFEESMQKALRMTHPSIDGFSETLSRGKSAPDESELLEAIQKPHCNRIYSIYRAFKAGWSVDRIHEISAIDKWYLHKLKNIIDVARDIECMDAESSNFQQNYRSLQRAKEAGFSDKQLGALTLSSELDMRKRRMLMGIKPFVKQIDTLAAEHPAKTNYLYTTYNGAEHDLSFNDNGTMVLGCGPYHIGSSVEFDSCAVSAIRTLRDCGVKTVVVNNNPETVSTDFDECDRLYFEELSLESVLDIYQQEQCAGAIVSVGGQIPNNLSWPLYKNGVNVLGTNPSKINDAEERSIFSQIMDELEIDQAPWAALYSTDDALRFAETVGYPCLLRPSFVLSGSAMNVAHNETQLRKFLSEATRVSQNHPVVITKFINSAKEIEMDAVAEYGHVVAHAVSEHVENAGVHSGDATLILPTQNVGEQALMKIRQITQLIADRFEITGPFNIQFLVQGSKVMVIECNLRASRSLPFVSKTINTDMIGTATKVMLGLPIDYNKLPHLNAPMIPGNLVGVKSPMFSWARLQNADPVLKCEMSSTGEIACYSSNFHQAFLKSIISAGFKMPKKSIFISTQDEVTSELIPVAEKLNMLGYDLYASSEMADIMNKTGIPVKSVQMNNADNESVEKSALDLIRDGSIDLVINIASQVTQHPEENYLIRRNAIDSNVPLMTNLQIVKTFAEALQETDGKELDIDTRFHYTNLFEDMAPSYIENERKTAS